MIRNLVFGVIVLTILPFSVHARDWQQWRGPFHNGSTDETNIPASWSETENVAWKADLPGAGGATPVISKGKIFVSSMVGRTGEYVALCINEHTGKKLWQRTVGSDSRRFPRNNHCSPSPVAIGETVVFTYGTGDIVAFDYAGRQLWSRGIEQEYGNLALQFGYSNTPLYHDGALFVIVLRRDHPYRDPEANRKLESFILKIDPKTGKTIWKQDRPTNVFDEGFEAYGTPVPFGRKGRIEILTTGADFITAHDPDSGKELWRYEYWTEKVRDSRVIPSPVTWDGIVFGTIHKSKGVFAVRPPEGDNGPQELWRYTDAATDSPTPLVYRNRLYVLDGMRHGKVVNCHEPKTGKVLWQGRIGGRGPWRASLTAADGKLYTICETGEVVVLSADPKEFKILFQTKYDEGPIQSSIPIANGRIYIRTAEKLYAISK